MKVLYSNLCFPKDIFLSGRNNSETAFTFVGL